MTDGDPTREGAIDTRLVRARFARAAATYDDAAVLHREVGRRMAERLEYVRLQPARVLDAGCGTGADLPLLRRRYPDADLVALDAALPMLAQAGRRLAPPASWLRTLLGVAATRGTGAATMPVCADLRALPLAPRSVDLAWSNLAIQWTDDARRALGELGRVLAVGGLLTFSTLGPDTLKELRAAFGPNDPHPRTLRFVDMHDVGDLLVALGFADPVMDMEMLTLTYPGADALFRDLRWTGARNALRDRQRGLTGRRRWERVATALESSRTEAGIPITWEVVYGHAWKAEPTRTDEGHPIVRFTRRPRGG